MLNQKWTIDEDNRLLELKLANKHWAVIAKQLNRTETSVISRFGVLKHRDTTDTLVATPADRRAPMIKCATAGKNEGGFR